MRKFAWLAAVAAVAGLTTGTAPAGAASMYLAASGPLTDLMTGTANATDGASASLWVVASATHTRFVLFVRDLDPAAAGTTFGAHIHVGPCVEDNGAAAGGHYNTGGAPGRDTEVWLDFTVRATGVGFARARVPFTIEPGAAQSLVIHVQPTQDSGAAGARQACMPVSF